MEERRVEGGGKEEGGKVFVMRLSCRRRCFREII